MQSPIRQLLDVVALSVALAFASSALAANEFNVDDDGAALKGYDPVAYFEDGSATPGSAEYTIAVDGVTYHFASAAHRDAFSADPDKYRPQFGGYCAMGTAMGKKFDVDPEAFRVVDGKLYMNLSKKVQVKWLEDVPGNIVKANNNWPKIKDKSPEEL